MTGAMHNTTDELPLLGDTTNNQVLLFSPVLANITLPSPPTYPNYTLPSANITQPPADPSLLNGLSLFLARTTTLNSSSLPLTGCAMRGSQGAFGTSIGAGNTSGSGLWLKDDDGWRFQWLVNGLSSQTNYTAYVIQNGTKLSGPINFVTKSGRLHCTWLSSQMLILRSSILLVSTRPLPPLLPLNRILRAHRTAGTPDPLAHRGNAAGRRHRAPARHAHQLHHLAHDVPLRARHVQSARLLRRLPGGVPQMALRDLVPAVLRGKSLLHHQLLRHRLPQRRERRAAARVRAVGGPRVRFAAEPGTAGVQQRIRRTATVPRDVHGRRARVPVLHGLRVPAAAFQCELQLRRRLHRQRRGRRAGRRIGGRGAGPFRKCVVQCGVSVQVAQGCVIEGVCGCEVGLSITRR